MFAITMSLNLIHKKSKKNIQFAPVVFNDNNLPYDVIPHAKFEVKYSIDSIDVKSQERLKNAPAHQRNIIFFDMGVPLPYGGIGVYPETSWQDIKSCLIPQIRKYGGYNKPEDIIDIAFGATLQFTPGVTKIVDTLNVKPYDAFPDFASVHVVMFKRASAGWRPLIVAYQMCANCGKTDSLKSCSSCKKTYYCSKECQKKDWKAHKSSCKK